jgi:uncharacterized protein YndB with AHSA1/START domain
VIDAESDSIVREVWIAASPEDVFPYFTDANKLTAWKAVWAEVDARPQGGFRADITGRGDIAAARISATVRRRLAEPFAMSRSYSWNPLFCSAFSSR